MPHLAARNAILDHEISKSLTIQGLGVRDVSRLDVVTHLSGDPGPLVALWEGKCWEIPFGVIWVFRKKKVPQNGW